MSFRRFLIPVLTGLMAVASASSARAGFEITITTSAGTIQIEDDGALDDAQGDPTSIQVNLEALNGLAEIQGAGLRFTALTLDSNNQNPSEFASLGLIATVIRNNLAVGNGSFQIMGTDTDFTFPDGIRTFETSGGPNLLRGNGSDPALQSTAQVAGYYDPNNMEYGTTVGLVSPVFTATSNSFQGEFNPAPVPVGTSFDPFSLTIIQSASLKKLNAEVRFATTSLVSAQAIPEPASLAMLFVGGSLLSYRSLRRRKTDA